MERLIVISNSPQSVTRVIRILEALCASPGPLTLADLSRALDTPKSSLAALLRGLAEEDFVVSVEGAYRLGPGAVSAALELGYARVDQVVTGEVWFGGLGFYGGYLYAF